MRDGGSVDSITPQGIATCPAVIHGLLLPAPGPGAVVEAIPGAHRGEGVGRPDRGSNHDRLVDPGDSGRMKHAGDFRRWSIPEAGILGAGGAKVVGDGYFEGSAHGMIPGLRDQALLAMHPPGFEADLVVPVALDASAVDLGPVRLVVSVSVADEMEFTPLHEAGPVVPRSEPASVAVAVRALLGDILEQVPAGAVLAQLDVAQNEVGVADQVEMELLVLTRASSRTQLLVGSFVGEGLPLPLATLVGVRPGRG